MTAADMLRHWAMVLRDLCEQHELRGAGIELEDGASLDYRVGEGLAVTDADGDELELFSDEWIDEIRWDLTPLGDAVLAGGASCE